MKNTLATELIKRFKTIHKKPPKWAWQFNPSIPLIGEKYKPGNGLLIYASAENLTWLKREKAPLRFSGEKAYNRYRNCYRDMGRNSEEFFPDVGIQPITDGGLLAAGLFIAGKHKLQKYTKPRQFLETTALSNWCKFSIKSESNKDYITNIKKLTASLPFVIAELVLLQPKVVLIPKQLWQNTILQAAMIGASSKTIFLPVPQFNSRVVNIHLKKYDRPAIKLRKQSQNTPIARWMENLHRINKNNAWRYIAMLAAQI